MYQSVTASVTPAADSELNRSYLARKLTGMNMQLSNSRVKLAHASRRWEEADALLGDQSADPIIGFAGARVPGRLGGTVYIKVLRVPDPSIGLLIGECATALRSALDYLAVRAVASGPAASSKSNLPQFPITDDPAKWASAKGGIKGSTPEFRAAVKAFQPAFRTDENASLLSMLAWLSNRDKHHDLHMTVGTPQRIRLAQPAALYHDNTLACVIDGDLTPPPLQLDEIGDLEWFSLGYVYAEHTDRMPRQYVPSRTPFDFPAGVAIGLAIANSDNKRVLLDRIPDIIEEVASVTDALEAILV